MHRNVPVRWTRRTCSQRQCHLVDHGRTGNPGSIHKPVHDAESRSALFDERVYEFWIRDIPHGCEDTIFRKLAASRFESFRVHVRKDQIRAKVGRELRNAEADALTCACDENRSPCQRHGIAAVHTETFRWWLNTRRLGKPDKASLRSLTLRRFAQRRGQRLPMLLCRMRDGLRVSGTLQKRGKAGETSFAQQTLCGPHGQRRIGGDPFGEPMRGWKQIVLRHNL